VQQGGLAGPVRADKPDDMRALLGVLRAEENGAGPEQQDAVLAPGRGLAPAPGLVPAPGLADLDRLVERTAEAGVLVDLDVRGKRPRLSAGLDLAAYRVIQEAITNVIKHAATGKCRVTVTYQEDALALEITDSGSDADAEADRGGSNGSLGSSGGGGFGSGGFGSGSFGSGGFGSGGSGNPATGHGIIGMRERVGMYGGEFRAAPLPGCGFRVTARFPLAGTEA